MDGGSVTSDRSRAEATEGDFVSPPRALGITVDPLDGGYTQAAISVPLLSPHQIRCRFDLKVEAASGTTSVVEFMFAEGENRASLSVQIRPTGIAVSEFRAYEDGGSTFVPHAPTKMAWPSDWMRVELIWVDSFRSSLIVNGTPTIEDNTDLHSDWFKGTTSVSYGNVFANEVTETPQIMWIDNVVIDVE